MSHKNAGRLVFQAPTRLMQVPSHSPSSPSSLRSAAWSYIHYMVALTLTTNHRYKPPGHLARDHPDGPDWRSGLLYILYGGSPSQALTVTRPLVAQSCTVVHISSGEICDGPQAILQQFGFKLFSRVSKSCHDGCNGKGKE